MPSEVKSSSLLQETWLMKFILDKRWSPVKHLILLLPLVSVFIPSFSDKAKTLIPEYDQLMTAVIEHAVVMITLSIGIIYFNLLMLVPRLLFKNKYLFYALATFGLGVLYYFIDFLHGRKVFRSFENYINVSGFNLKDFIDNILLPLIFLGATTGYKVFKKWLIDTQRWNDLQKAQLQEELNSLKNQVNPHFLFNTLNNLNTLVKTDADKASVVILGLSDVLRYQIYDSTKEKILLSKDIEMLSQFLMLEKIRRDNFKYEIIVEKETANILVPPLLFINFVDNALKHGTDIREPAFCKLQFIVEPKHLHFVCINSKPSVISKKEHGGVGIRNIKRRLVLLYGTLFNLELKDELNLYTVKLSIPV